MGQKAWPGLAKRDNNMLLHWQQLSKESQAEAPALRARLIVLKSLVHPLTALSIHSATYLG